MRALVHLTRTGKPVVDLELHDWDFDTGILAPDKLTVSVPSYTKRALSMDLGELLTPYKYSIALVDESVEGMRYVPASGPITARPPEDSEDGKHRFEVTARGIETLLDYRGIRLFPGWPMLRGDGRPNGTYDVRLRGLSLGTIIKRLVQESERFPGGDLPIVYEPDRAGIHERVYEAIDGKPVLEALDQIGDLIDGVEYDFVPEIDEFDNISYRLVTGLDGDGRIVPRSSMLWNAGGPMPDVVGWEPNDRVSEIATDAIFSSGDGDDVTLLARASDPTLIDAGWPRLEVWDSSHSTVSNQATLQGWADGRVSRGYLVPQLRVRAVAARGLRHGDLVSVAGGGHWLLPDEVQSFRVLSVERSASDPEWVGVQLTE